MGIITTNKRKGNRDKMADTKSSSKANDPGNEFSSNKQSLVDNQLKKTVLTQSRFPNGDKTESGKRKSQNGLASFEATKNKQPSGSNLSKTQTSNNNAIFGKQSSNGINKGGITSDKTSISNKQSFSSIQNKGRPESKLSTFSAK